ncbi:MAG: serine/threonine-protein phosphatase [Magnetococcales bacterium]|nr:serine/threonine-protein phosphatase [Magnetococcales bacterium]
MTQQIGKRLLVAGSSNVGCVRTLNEDNFLIDEQIGLLVVADGMGGHDAGEVASQLVVDSIRNTLHTFMRIPQESSRQIPSPRADDWEPDNTPPAGHKAHPNNDEPTVDEAPNPILSVVQSAVNRANAAVNSANMEKGYMEGMGMGSTLVGLWLPEYSEKPVIFHVGDSRLYLFSKGQLTQATQDHSMYQQWINFGRRGEPPAQNILLQAMGPSNYVTPDIGFQDVASGDLVLLRSDGLTGMVPVPGLAAVLGETHRHNLDESCARLIEMARKAGGKDNITVILGCFI